MPIQSSLKCRFRSLLTLAAASATTCSASGASYPAQVLGDAPAAYYRFGESAMRGNINANSGSLGAAGNATNTFNVRAFPGAIAGSANRAQFFDSSAWGMIPYQAGFNPANDQPFTIEAWFYPASDQINGGQCPLNNRFSGSGVDRTGWVFFQRAPNDTYSSLGGYEGVGWNFRMYRGSGSSSGLDVVSQVPYEVGKWTHVVVVYDPVDPISNASLTMYINGVPAVTNTWTGGDDGASPGYVANSASSDVALSLGAYNNVSGAGGNSYFGAVDEFAVYANKLSAEQVLAHYQNGTNANRTTPYETLVQAANPAVYLRLDELSPVADTALNLGDMRGAGAATNSVLARHPAESALAGAMGDGSWNGHYRVNRGSVLGLPWTSELNPDASVPFTFELWVNPLNDLMSPGPSPACNRRAGDAANRTGWVIYQRDPNETYSAAGVPGSSGIGYNFRMYTGEGGSGHNVTTSVPYAMGEWQHLVFTWQPAADMGSTSSGSEQWQGTLSAYVNGVLVDSNAEALYAANVSETDDGGTPADFAIGAYNQSSKGGEEFEGNIDEVAFYNNYALTPEQILAHYQTGTNAHPATNYETLVLMAAYNAENATPQRTAPKLYLRFNEPARFPADNAGALGATASGNLIQSENTAAGPASAGFETSNPALALDGVNGWVSLNQPAGLDFTNQITLEAWVKPGATQGDNAYILAHGPATPTSYDLATYALTLTGTMLETNALYFSIEGGTNYVAGVASGPDFRGVTAPVGTDLGSAQWIHLAATYDGTAWRIFRNGAQLASAADTTGSLPVIEAEWAIGAAGNGWADTFAGAIDEVAIYSKALTPAQIQAHYAASQGSTPSPSLTIERSGTNVILTWNVGSLQSADTVDGTYSNVAGATSPYTTAATSTAKFYRIR